jgi:amidase
MRNLFAAAVVVSLAGLVSAQKRSPPAATWAGDRYNVLEKTIPELQTAMAGGSVTSRDIVEIYLARIEAYDRRGPRINSIISVNPRALEEATALDRERASRGARGPLHGIPVVVKDNFDLHGVPTTAGTIAFATLYPADDAFQVRKLKEAGAVVIAKTNLQELASGIVTVGSMGGQTLNPYDLGRNPGGSSGGTGAAVAANLAAAGLGSDTCGSIRIPASHNNLVGLRPTLGLSSRDGIVPLSHTQDVGGPLARTVTDLVLLLDATAGADPADETTKASTGKVPKSYREGLKTDALKGARIGLLVTMFGDAPEDGEAGTIVRRAVDEMKKQGAEVVDVVVPGLDELLRGSSVIDAEFRTDLAEYLSQVPNAPVKTLDDIIKRGLLHAAVDTSARRRNLADPQSEPFRRARVKRAAIKAAMAAAFEENRLEAVVYPTMRRKPALIGEPQQGGTCQLSASSGLPALTVPAGFTADGLPIGLELLGPAFSEPRLLALAYSYEQSSKNRRPPFSAPALAGRSAPPAHRFSAAAGQLKVDFIFEPTTAELKFDAKGTGLVADDVFGVWIQRGSAEDRGPAVHQLLPRGEVKGAGSFRIPPSEHSRLREGRYYLVLYTRSNPFGDLRAQLVMR